MNYQGKILSHRVWFKAAAGKNEKTAQSSHRKAGALRERLPEEVAVQSPSDVALWAHAVIGCAFMGSGKARFLQWQRAFS